MNTFPIPTNEMERIMALSEFDLDYSNLQNNFKNLTRLAAKVAGTEISLVNLIDTYTQWTVSNYGIELQQMDREDSACQYTIMQNDGFEVPNLSLDDRFKDKFYVAGELSLRYYYGVPLNVNGFNIGALCVLDKQKHNLTPEKEELLKVIADEIVNRLKVIKAMESLQTRVDQATESQRRLAHDIRGPLGGIIGLAQLINEQGEENNMEEMLEFINLIYKSSKSILELADEILTADKKVVQPKTGGNEYDLTMLKDKLIKLYLPQARNKQINLTVNVNPDHLLIPFSKSKLLQIIGNLVSNAIKFTPAGGNVSVDLSLAVDSPVNMLQILVKDEGIGMDSSKIESILNGQGESTTGTGGEQGYGFGLALVKHLVQSLKGTITIASKPGSGTTFNLQLPQGISH